MRIEPGAFSAFQNLNKLNLHHNNLTTVLASWFSNPGHLKNLTLSVNNIKEVGPYMFSSFSNLTILNLANNRIHMIAMESLRNLSKLKILDLSGNNLSVLKRDIFSDLRSPTMKLGHNPWNCSCELQDFGAFLQELLNTSRLEDASSVTCHSPITLKGLPVWNISDFGCLPTVLPASLGNVLDKTMVLVTLVCVVLFVLLWLFLVLWKLKHNRVHGQAGKGTAVGTCRKVGMRPWKSRRFPSRNRQVTIKEMTSQIATVEQPSGSSLASLPSSEHSGPNLGSSKQTGQTSQFALNGVDSASLNSFHHHREKLRTLGTSASMELSCESPFCTSEPVKHNLKTLEMSGIDGGGAWVKNSEALEYFTLCVKKSSCSMIEPQGVVQSRTPKPFPLKRSQTWPQKSGLRIKEQSPRTHILTIPAKDSPDEVKSTEIHDDLQADLHVQRKAKPKRTSVKTLSRLCQKLAQLEGHQRTRELSHRQGKVGQVGASATVSLRPEISLVSSLDDTQPFDKSQAIICDLLHEVVENHGRWTREHWKKTHQPRRVRRSLKDQHLPHLLPP
uniref:LRRCT domain-containing protein n=2 Tax=Monodelphis domestica TaxID=13616 RepID=A0A5F8HBF2_MONDO